MTQKRSTKRIKIIAAILAVSAFTAANGYFYTQARHMSLEATKTQTKAYEAYEDYSRDLNNASDQIDELNSQNEFLLKENENLKEKLKEARREVSRGSSRAISVEVTAYTLSPGSCGKGAGHPAYGRTATGKNLAGHTLESARTIAVDPSVIPLGSRVRIHFSNPKWQHLNGVYIAADTGGAIRGNRIDLFFGESDNRGAMRFGRQEAVLEVI